MNFTYKNKEAAQSVHTRFYCQWSAGAKEYFNTLDEALTHAEKMYIKKPNMGIEDYRYWLNQKQYVGVETIIDTPIKTIFSPNTILHDNHVS